MMCYMLGTMRCLILLVPPAPSGCMQASLAMGRFHPRLPPCLGPVPRASSYPAAPPPHSHPPPGYPQPSLPPSAKPRGPGRTSDPSQSHTRTPEEHDMFLEACAPKRLSDASHHPRSSRHATPGVELYRIRQSLSMESRHHPRYQVKDGSGATRADPQVQERVGVQGQGLGGASWPDVRSGGDIGEQAAGSPKLPMYNALQRASSSETGEGGMHGGG